MGQLSAQEAGMQSRLNSMIVQFNNQNNQNLLLLLRLGELTDLLTGNTAKEIANNDEVMQTPNGIVPQIQDCLLKQNNHIQRLESIVKDLSEYI